MHSLLKLRSLFAVATAAALAAGCGGGGHDDDDESPAPAALLNNPDPLGGCSALAPLASALSSPGMQVAITSATLRSTATTDASGNYRPYCAVVGTINGGRVGNRVAGQTEAVATYAIAFQVNLPSTWNGNLFFAGGGGSNGSIPNTTGTVTNGEAVNPLLAGYATASTDTGHSNATNNDPANGGTAAFGLDNQARLDFGYNGIGLTKQLANKLIERYYGKAQTHSYFAGCSEGGREAMMVAQRFGSEFDGVVAGDPGSDLPKAWLAEAWDTQQFASAARAQNLFETTGPGAGTTPLLNAAIRPAQWTALQQAVLAQCDAADGLADGMTNKPCNFDLSRVTCGTAGAPAECLSSVQATALQRVMAGARNSAGTALYSDWPWDPGIGAPGWLAWKTGAYSTTGTNTAINVTLGGGAGPLIFTTPPTLGLGTANSLVQYQLNFNFDTDAPKISATSATYPVAPIDFMGTHSTDLSAFKARGGRMILYHGLADPVFSFKYTARWIDSLSGNSANGNPRDFVRLFGIPGMNHCSGGPATDNVPVFTALVNWLEKGQAPDRIVAQSSPAAPAAFGWALPAGATTRVRPLCPYPQYAHYIGATGTSAAALAAQNNPSSYVCTNP
ncbi:tannase/feruloyl esterase family alpha/beta hydrolase [Piscinibacter koreensis]|uniref:Tannase/feruloyl esterase family alpha/beta hydrolase n=1 Tax=Piscinibacter koreensis TaxID=2742824 RepID=A0A7Y6NKH9_9BURK|nr:tannase/feruloyl esterase family alpha/beta hydrolase [Schlegelella koreensis]NUZ04815.1 tannase/feruloyl esterase family alpha/beta hydrolase [Schlegelella koreensis]